MKGASERAREITQTKERELGSIGSEGARDLVI
jgi:hypothetical protein